MHGRPLTLIQRLSMLVVAALWLAIGGGLAYVATTGFTEVPTGYATGFGNCSALLLLLGVAAVLCALRFVKSALTPHRPYDFEAEKPDANPDLSSGDD